MNNINKYNTSIDYQTAKLTSHTRPSLSYAADIDHIYYDGSLNNETTDKRLSRVGDWVLAKADGSKLFVGDEVYQSKYINSNEWTAIAKVVVPYNAFGDKTVRCCSLVKMDYNDPENGSSAGTYVYWGKNAVVPSLGDYSNNYSIVPGTSTVSTTTSPAYLASDLFKNVASLDYQAFYESGKSAYSIPMYYGDKPWDFLNTIPSAWIDGKANTELIQDVITADITGSTITNSYSVGHYPAASCCLRYHTVGTSAGDWYLPSVYELLFLYERTKTININLGSDSYWSST